MKRREFLKSLGVAGASVAAGGAAALAYTPQSLAFHPHTFWLQADPLDIIDMSAAAQRLANSIDEQILDKYMGLRKLGPITLSGYWDPS